MIYPPVKVNPGEGGGGEGHPEDSDIGPSDHTGNSDNNYSF